MVKNESVKQEKRARCSGLAFRDKENPAFDAGKIFLKDKLHQQHVENRASCDGKQHLAFPNVKRHYSGDADGLRDTVTAGKNRHIFETVDDQQSEYGCGENLSEILNIFWWVFPEEMPQRAETA